MPVSRRSWFALITLFGLTPVAGAKPPHKQALVNHFGPFLPKKLDDCRTCHIASKPDGGNDAPLPHNPFGARLAELRDELKLAGKPADIPARLEEIALEDTDGDGVPNLAELLSGHGPGDATDKPTAEELAKVEARLTAFRKYQKGYPWRPFQPVQRPPVPSVRNGGLVKNPLDAFVAAGHEEHGLSPRSEAPKAVLLRRVYLDLTGLPPTRSELQAFLSDPAVDAYDQVVERLLASPRYGERWGRHWMDVWRYSDWAGWGQQVRDSQPHIWRWRDWIVESLNQDKGYDRMILEMLAGDELAPDDPDTLRATGYLVRNYKLLSRERWLQDTVEHTFLAFQAVTINCARCHDHMYDPIEQREYYQVRAVFEPHQVRIDRRPGEANTQKDGLARAYDAELQAPTYLFIRGDDRSPDKSTIMAPGVPAALGLKLPRPEPLKLSLTASAPDKRDFVIRETVTSSEQALADTRAKVAQAVRREGLAAIAPAAWWSPLEAVARLGTLAKYSAERRLAELDAESATLSHAALLAVLKVERLEDEGKTDSPAWATAAADAQDVQRRHAVARAQRDLVALESAPVPTDPKQKTGADQKHAEARKVLVRALANLHGPPAASYARRSAPTYPATSTGRRLAFARWLAARENPLTARVAVNHIWLRHFGQALVPSVFDFGRNGRLPSSPALVDWLAAELMDKNWSMKHIHRLIVTSNTYRQASTPETHNLSKDPDNVYYWRMTPHRLEAEAVRDLAIHVAGRLDGTMGGPDLDQAQGLTVPRRSLYFRHAAEKQMEFLKLFDAASVTECYQRRESVIPQQALALFNSGLVIQHARVLARQLARETGGDATAFVQAAFETVLSRPATAAETRESVAFLNKQAATHSGTGPSTPVATTDALGQMPSPDPAVRARENLVQVLMNHHDFVMVR